MFRVMPEGFSGVKENFAGTVWDEAYDAMNQGRVIQGRVVGVEKDLSTNEEVLVVKYGHYRCIMTKDDIGGQPKKLVGMVGNDIVFKIKAVDRNNNCVYVERASVIKELAMQTWSHLEEAEKILKSTQKEIQEINGQLDAIRTGEVIAPRQAVVELKHKREALYEKTRQLGPTATCTVRWVLEHAAYVDIGGIIAMLPKGEISYGFVSDAREHLRQGQSFDVKIVWVDRENGVVRVSLRALLPDPWEKAKEEFKPGGCYLGKVINIGPNGPKVELAPSIIVATPQPAFEKDKVGIGDEVTVRLSKIRGRKIFGSITRNLSRPAMR